jgi:quinol-cytochrome oxidoreductase complex cytochrome b subunit
MLKVNNNLLVAVLVIIIISLLFIVFYRKPTAVYYEPFDPKPYEDSIKALKDAQNKLDWELIKAYNSLDSIKEIPAKIIYVYEKQKAFIPNATTRQLDSIIRANI